MLSKFLKKNSQQTAEHICGNNIGNTSVDMLNIKTHETLKTKNLQKSKFCLLKKPRFFHPG